MAKKNNGFIGWVAVVETGSVYYFSSDYSSKASVLKNVARCVGEHISIEHPTIAECQVYTTDLRERCVEDAEHYATDTNRNDADGCYTIDKTMVVVRKVVHKKASQGASVDHPDTCIFEIAREYGADSRFVKELFDCYMLVVNGSDYEEEAQAFKEMFDTFRQGKAVA